MPRPILVLLMLCGGLAMAGCAASFEGGEVDRRACVYAGSGAVLARDVEAALDRLAIPYRRVDEFDVKGGRLKACSALIFPAGYTERCVAALGREGFEHIREFVAGGGGYIGICMGAYIAPQTVEVPGHPPGLGIIDIRNRREAGRGLRTIEIAETDHPLVKGYEGEIEIWYQNGPMIEVGKGVEVLAVYEKGSAAIVCSTYGEGRVVIFSPHPEGSLKAGIDPGELGTLKLLGNAISFAQIGKSPKGSWTWALSLLC